MVELFEETRATTEWKCEFQEMKRKNRELQRFIVAEPSTKSSLSAQSELGQKRQMSVCWVA